ncbi:DUF554 family protein, partial [Virgibacillus salexigens]|uniref:DUF554 family protein n=1 Tax=Virgibacillus massiliensis TaxID=1462526 RepID=UPI0018E1BDB9
MALYGTLVNGVLIIIGSLFGLLFTKIPERYKETVMQEIGLAVMLIGIQMALSTEYIIVVLLSLLSGAIIGELIHLESGLNRLGNWVGSKFTSTNSTNSDF